MVTKLRGGEEKIETGKNLNLESSDEVLINCNKTNSDLERGGPKATLIDQFYAQEDAYYNLLKKKQRLGNTCNDNSHIINDDKNDDVIHNGKERKGECDHEDTTMIENKLKEQDLLRQTNLDLSDMVIEVRNVVEEDMDEMIDLHEELFPIKYSRSWYESVISGTSIHDPNTPLYNWALVLKEGAPHQGDTKNATPTSTQNATDSRVKTERNQTFDKEEEGRKDIKKEKTEKKSDTEIFFNSNDINESEGETTREKNEEDPDREKSNTGNCSFQHKYTKYKQKLSQGSIVGMATAQFMPVGNLMDGDLVDILKNKYQLTHILYILTLGVRRQYRSRNLATLLLHKCIDHSRSLHLSAGLFLHVIVNNQGAIGFYLKNGFHLLEEIPNFYEIQNNFYDSYVYVYLFEEEKRKIWNELDDVRKRKYKAKIDSDHFIKNSPKDNISQNDLERMEKGTLDGSISEEDDCFSDSREKNRYGSNLGGILESILRPLSTIGSYLLTLVHRRRRPSKVSGD